MARWRFAIERIIVVPPISSLRLSFELASGLRALSICADRSVQTSDRTAEKDYACGFHSTGTEAGPAPTKLSPGYGGVMLRHDVGGTLSNGEQSRAVVGKSPDNFWNSESHTVFLTA